MKTWTFAVLNLLLFGSTAFSAVECGYQSDSVSRTDITRMGTLSLGCLVWVTPHSKPDLIYREFLIDERGRLAIFNSLGEGPAEEKVVYRTYFLFPRRNLPAYRIGDDGTIAVTMPSGTGAVFSADSSKAVSIEGMEFEEDPQVNLTNAGGFEIKSFQGIWMDNGWAMNDPAYFNPDGKSIFHDRKGQACEIQNSDFFDYKNILYSEPVPMYETDWKLAMYLTDRCPKLDLSPLLGMGFGVLRSGKE